MRAAILKTTFIAACNSDSNASPPTPSSAASVQLLPTPRTPHIAFQYSKTSPTRCLATSMFEVPLERPCSDSNVEGNLLLEPVNPFFSKNPSLQHTFFQGTRHKRNGRRRSRARLLSVPQGLSKNGDFLNVIGATGLPMARSGRLQGRLCLNFCRLKACVSSLLYWLCTRTSYQLKLDLFLAGPGGVCMALVVTLVALLAAAKQGLSMGSSQHQEISCLMCKGLRYHRCGLCKGRGIVEWEGKLRHTDPCPRCFGSRRIKCSKCDGG